MIAKYCLTIERERNRHISGGHALPNRKFGPCGKFIPHRFAVSSRTSLCRERPKSQNLLFGIKSQKNQKIRGRSLAQAYKLGQVTLQKSTTAAKSYNQNATGEPKFPSGILVRLVGFRDKQSVLRRKNDGGYAFFPPYCWSRESAVALVFGQRLKNCLFSDQPRTQGAS
jgi:hypothetical protein